MNSPIERLTKKEERSGFLMATLDEDELYAVQNFIAGMKATKEYVKMQEKEKEKAEKCFKCSRFKTKKEYTCHRRGKNGKCAGRTSE